VWPLATVLCGFAAVKPGVGRQNRREPAKNRREATQNLPKGPKPCAQRKQNRREAAKNRREATKKP